MSEIRIHSPILSKMPETHVGLAESARRVSKRIMIFGPPIATLAILVIIVWLQLLPEDGIGQLLYAIHDTFFLPLKGYTYTLFYPFSLVWWIIILTILGLMTASLLLDRSFLKRPHVWLLRQFMHHANLHWFLIGGSRFFKCIGLQPHLIRLVARRELEAALINLSMQPLREGTETQCRRVSDLTRLDMQLERYFSTHELSVFRILERWQHSYLLIHAYGNNSQKWFQSILTDMFTAYENYDFSVIESELLMPNNHCEDALFEPAELLQETSILFTLGVELSQGKVVEPDDQRCLTLVRCVDKRRKLIYTTARMLQRELLRPNPGVQPRLHLPWLAQTELELAIAGRLALGIALHLSLFTQSTALAETYIEALDELKLSLDATTGQSHSLERLRYLILEFIDINGEAVQNPPLWHAYHLLVKLNEERLYIMEEEWQSLIDDSKGPVKTSDVDLAHWHVQRMWTAAGPAVSQENLGKGDL